MQNLVENSPLFPILIGQGKLARHLHHYLHLITVPHKHFDDARDLAEPDLYRKIREVNAIWILTSDQSIEPVMNELKSEMIKQDINPSAYTWIHSSAATTIAGMHTFHPLMTFSEDLYTLEQYQAIPFALISPDAKTLSLKFPLPNTTFTIPVEQAPFYHATAVMMSNLPILLWSLTSAEAKKKLSLDPQVFNPILNQTLENFLKNGDAALTGPIARNDIATIEKNLSAISNTPLSKIYEVFL
jgi:hypothetical protein